MSRTILGDFTDAFSAESYLKANSPTGNWPYLFFYQLELMLKYRTDNRYPVTIFDRNGNMRGGYDNYKSDCFPGRMEADCHFKVGDIVQFGHHKLLLGVVESLPPDPAFVAQVEGQNGMLDAVEIPICCFAAREARNTAIFMNASCLSRMPRFLVP